MIAKVVKNGREYYSHIFASFNPGWYECVIVFDNENNKFELLDIYDRRPSLKRRVFVIDTDKTDMVKKKELNISIGTTYKDCLGYSWILENRDLIKAIKNGKDVDEYYIKLAEEINRNIDTSEWKYVNNQKDAENLMSAAWGFHDAVIKSIHYKINEQYDAPSCVEVLFTGCWECDIILKFKYDILVHFKVDDNIILDILDSSILFHNGFIYWVDDYIQNVERITEQCTYFRARSLAWRMITNNDSWEANAN